MPALPFTQRIRQPAPLLVDGAMGTMLHEQGLPIGACFDALCLHEPERVARVHRAFLDAGSELLETNTFSANRFKLANHGLEDQLTAINRAAVRVAREAMRESEGESLYLAGSIGPLGVRLQPYGRVAREDARAAFRQQAEALLAEGVDLIVLETFSDLNELLEGLAALRELDPSMPVACQMTFENDDRTQLGWLPGAVARGLMDAGADIIGINCSSGPAQIARLLQAMQHSAPGQRYSAQPNAGFPEAVGDRVMYPATVDYFADYALTFRDLGAVLIGGCCGTQPDHVAAMRRALDDPQASSPPLPALVHIEDEEDLAPDRPTRLADQLTRREFVISVEMAPPRSYTPQRLLNAARTLQEAGADVINVADSPAARMRMSPWAIGHLLQSRLGMETVLHFPTRGRNLLRVQGDLLAAHALGLRNLFVVMGDPTQVGDYPEAMDLYDLAPSALIHLIRQRLNHGLDQAGHSIGQPTSFTVGCALNMNATSAEREIRVLLRKLQGGASFALGQAIFEPERIRVFHEHFEALVGEPLRLPVLMGLMPLYSVKHARFLHNEVPGIHIPPQIIERMGDAGEDAPREGLRIAGELLAAMRDQVQGTYIIPAFGRYDLAADLVDQARALAPA